MNTKPKIAFLIRKHPRSIGGVQRHSVRLYEGLSGTFDIEKISWSGPEWGVPFYFPIFYYRSVRNGAEVIHCDDAVTALIGAKIRNNSAKRVIATVHGLDVILQLPWYQKKLRENLHLLDKVICVSRATAEAVRFRGVPDEKIEIIPNAADDIFDSPRKTEEQLNKFNRMTGIDIRNKIVLYSLGRPIRRKGFDYFADKVFPLLPENCVYLMAGPSPKTPSWLNSVGPLLGEKRYRTLLMASGSDTIHDRLLESGKHPRIHYLNDISGELREILYSIADIFIMPNRTVEGDMEGFGIVAIEAAARGIPVIATGIEGIVDAVIDGENGYCFPEGDAAAMANKITDLIINPAELTEFGERAAKFTRERFSSEKVHGRYKEIFKNLIEKR